MSNAIVGSIVDVHEEGFPTFRGCVTEIDFDKKVFEVVTLSTGMIGGYSDSEVSDYLIENINNIEGGIDNS